MTYLPPANGGRINASITGNTAGVRTVISSGTMVLAGGNNVTLSQNANTITINAGGGVAGINTLGMSNLGNSAGASGVITGSALQYAFAGGNNITLSQAINGSSATLSVAAANQSVQTQNVHNLSLAGNTAGVMAQVSSGTLTLAGGNNITLSQNGNAVTINGGAGAGGIALANSQAAFSSGTVNLIEGGGAITIASTTGQSLKIAVPAVSSLTGTGIVNIATNGSTVSIGAPAFSAGISTNANYVGTSGFATNQLMLVGGNNITLSQATGAGGNTITISAGNAGTGAGGGIGLANSQTTFTTGNVNLIEGGGAITIASTTGQSFKVAVPAVSTLSATGAVSIVTNGSVVSIGAPSVTLQRFEYPDGIFTSINTVVNGSMSINHMYVPFNVAGSAVKIGVSLSGNTNTSATTASANVSLWMGIYTLTSNSLTLMSSGSAVTGFQWSQSASTTANSSINGMRQLTVPMSVNITPGQYWMAAVISSATTYTGAPMTIYGNNMVGGTAVLSPIGSNTSVNFDALLLQGIYGTTVTSGPATIVGTQINNASASYAQRANFYNIIYNSTY